MDLSNTDNMIAITQLKEEVESLKKQLSIKDSQILERDKKVKYISEVMTNGLLMKKLIKV